MGYTHYYKVEDWSAPEWQSAWPQLIQDTSTIIDAVPDIFVSGPAMITLKEGEDVPNPPIVDVNEGICINGVASYDESPFDDFVLKESEPDSFCKTGQLPYDLVVSCILLRAYRLAPNTFHLSSDGAWNQEEGWIPTRALYHDIWPNVTDEKPAEIDEEPDENE